MSDPTDPASGGGQTPPPGPPPAQPPAAPPPGGAPPPPPGGAAPPPPPAAGGGYSAAPPPGSDADGVEAFKWGWAKFTENIGGVIIAILAWLGAAIVFGIIGFVLIAIVQGFFTDSIDTGFGTVERYNPGFIGTALVVAVGAVTWILVFTVPTYAIQKGALAVADGRELTTAEIFNFDNFVPFFITSLVVSIIIGILSLICFGILGIVGWFLMFFAPLHSTDTGASFMDSIKHSYETVTKNIGPMLIFVLLAWVAYFVGAILCGIGLLVAVPVVIFGTVYMYRHTSGQPVVAA